MDFTGSTIYAGDIRNRRNKSQLAGNDTGENKSMTACPFHICKMSTAKGQNFFLF